LPRFAVKVPQKTYSERICFFAALPKFDFEYFHVFRSVSRRRFLPQSGGTIPQKSRRKKRIFQEIVRPYRRPSSAVLDKPSGR